MTISDSPARVLITGGGSGIGRALALALAKRGDRVLISGRNQEKLDQVDDEADDEVLVKAADVADRDSVAELFDFVGKSLGGLDVLVNCAGVNTPKRSSAVMTAEDWDRLLTINATGAFNCIHRALPGMRKQGGGLIINVSSVAGIRANPLGGVAYNASKFAMSALGLSVGEEEREHGIRVTNVYPGEVDTPILKDRPTPVTDEHRARILKAEDIADAILMVIDLPPRARVPELTVIPTGQSFV